MSRRQFGVHPEQQGVQARLRHGRPIQHTARLMCGLSRMSDEKFSKRRALEEGGVLAGLQQVEAQEGEGRRL